MTCGEFIERAIEALPYIPNGQQSAVLGALTRFCAMNGRASRERVFVLNGYAGTGKTSLIGALVKTLRSLSVPVVLMAPTGRAAKVFSAYAGMRASTIHRRIYRHSLNGEPPGMQTNKEKNAIFIVDEASMISGTDDAGGQNLLEDLLQYVYTGENCRLILVGDTAQLPPVGCETSPAMDTGVLHTYGLAVTHATLTAVARQDELSGILANATRQRRAMRLSPIPQPRLETDGYDDVAVISPEELADVLSSAYARADGVEDTILVTRSNRRAVDFNRAIRSQVLYYEEELVRGELLMVAKNNYYWQRGVKGLDFVANGDIVRIERVYGTENRYGFHFADVRACLPDCPGPAGEPVTFDTKIMLETLSADTPALSPERLRALYQAIAFETMQNTEVTPRSLSAVLRDSPWWNALQVKYAYAVTCHKAQGGQWNDVVVDMVGIAPDAIGLDFYRWLYTATTRARRRLYYLMAAAD